MEVSEKMSKRYYWLKLQQDFFTGYRVRKIRTLENGDTLLIIYLKMQLLTLSNDGIYSFSKYEDSLEKELAFALGENEEDLRRTLEYLKSVGLAEIGEDGSLFLPDVIDNTGNETDEALQKRKERAKQRLNAQKTDDVGTMSGQCPEVSGQCPIDTEKNDIDIKDKKDKSASALHSDEKKSGEKRNGFSAEDEAEMFDRFWNAYPKKKDKKRARDAFTKMLKNRNLPEIGSLLEIIEQNKKSSEWKAEGGRFIPFPSTWLNECRWEDEIPNRQFEIRGKEAFADLKKEDYEF